eukprot:TRINITY_DN66601_c3_g1_i1.p1 TRINITY_DN66601_c3_g1~~TRINITY_DN66601_c3_g1_i1.p1  ORF type:complete len:419 (-),score=190.85 TRINITY_DN66601_c3_g1_i1:89-1345(-)
MLPGLISEPGDGHGGGETIVYPLSVRTSKWIFASTSLLSIAGALAIVVTYLTKSKLREKRLYHMVFWMSICDAIFSFKYLGTSLFGELQRPQVDLECYLEFIASQFFGLASLSWYFCITLETFRALSIHTRFSMDPSVPPVYHAYVWGVSTATTLLAAAFGNVGPSQDGTCWISGKQNYWRLVFYAPLFLYIMTALALLAYLCKYREFIFAGGGAARLRARMIAFVLCFVIVWSWPCAFRLFEFFTETKEHQSSPMLLVALHDFMNGIQGFVNFMIWMTTPTMLTLCCGRCRNDDGDSGNGGKRARLTSTQVRVRKRQEERRQVRLKREEAERLKQQERQQQQQRQQRDEKRMPLLTNDHHLRPDDDDMAAAASSINNHNSYMAAPEMLNMNDDDDDDMNVVSSVEMRTSGNNSLNND